MERKTIIDIMKKMAETANIEASKEVFGYFLYGSQNYGMADENSDIDIYCITVPSFEEVLFGYNKNASYKIDQSSEKSKITTKNIVDFFRDIEKGNFTNLELLFTPYVIINEKYAEEWEELRNMRFALLQGNPVGTINSILGQAESYLKEARDKEERETANGKPLANYLRLISSVEKYCNKNFASLYELTAAQDVVLKSMKSSPEVFRVGPRAIPRELYGGATTVTSMQIREKNKKSLIKLFKNILMKR